MSKTYREVYDLLRDKDMSATPDLYRELGMEILDEDIIDLSIHSLIISLIYRVKELEEKCSKIDSIK